MCIRLCNDYPWYVNYPSDPVVHVETSSVCGSEGPAAHVCRLMNSLSVCWDAVTRTLKCYLLGFPTLQIKLFTSLQLKSKLRSCLQRLDQSWMWHKGLYLLPFTQLDESLSFPAINMLPPPTRDRQSKAKVIRKRLEGQCFSAVPWKLSQT